MTEKAPAKKATAKRTVKKKAPAKPVAPEVSETPAFDAALEATGVDLRAIQERELWDFERAYKDLFDETPDEYRDRTYGAPKRRGDVKESV